MKLDKLEEFKADIHSYIDKLNIDDVNGVCKYICKLVVEEKKERLEETLMDKLYNLLENKTNEVVEIVCNHLGVRRQYDSGERFREDIQDCGTARSRLRSRLGSRKTLAANKSTSEKNSNLLKRVKKAKDLKWSDIARCSKGKRHRCVNIPCGNLMESGVCLNVDSCGFSHKNGAVIKSKVTKFTSFYDTTKEKIDYRSYILPEQSGYYDKMIVLPGASQEDTISISSSDNEPRINLTTPPRIFEPPSMLDSPLWYKEMGLVEEETDSDSQKCRLHRHRSLIVSNIPKHMNNIGILNNYFRRFGVLRNITVNYKRNFSKALIEFRLSKDMLAANKCVDSVLGNRFIRTRPLKNKRKKLKRRKDGDKKRRSCSKRSYSSDYRSRSLSSGYGNDFKPKSERVSNKIENDNSGDRSLSREVQRSNSKESGEYSSLAGSPEQYPKVVMTDDIERNSIMKKEVVVEAEVVNRGSVEEEMEVEGIREENGVVRRVVVDTVEEGDVKLERALNESDVEESDVDDNCNRVKRQVVMKTRRRQLQEDNTKNSLKKKLSRTTDSLNYYKSILEELIVEYRRNDKPGKSKLISKIKETHSKYMELKTLRGALSSHCAATVLDSQQDSLRGQICGLSVTVADTTTVTNDDHRNIYIEVPADIVLDPVQIQGHLGDDFKIENIEKLQSPCEGACYVITFQSASIAARSIEFLSTNNPMNWHIGINPPQ